jgi:hypothetical protein
MMPEATIARLQKAEARQRRETLARNLFAERVDIASIWTGLCGCGCGDPLDVTSKWDSKTPPPGYPVIAHVLARGSKGEHSRENVSIWRWSCNRQAAGHETSEAASVKRFSVVKGRPKSGKIASRGFQRGRKHVWPKRRMK